LLPSVAAALRELAAAEPRAAAPAEAGEEPPVRRALAVALSFHWLMEHAHYKAVRNRLGLCLPPLLLSLDRSTDPTARFVGLDALHLMLDRALVVEVQNFVPPLEHCFSANSPLFLEGDELAVSTVVPYCAGYVLFLTKAHAVGSGAQRDALDRFLHFGSVHCRASGAAFRLFVEFGLLPLLLRDPMFLAPRLKQLMELLLQATEAVNATEVLLAWWALHLLLGGELRPRARHYAMDLLLRLALGYLTFVASGPPPHVDAAGPCPAECLSPVVRAMTAAEWALVERRRPALQRAFEAGLRLLADACPRHVEEMLAGLEAKLPKAPRLAPQLRAFVTLGRGQCAAAADTAAAPAEDACAVEARA